ncbi:MAG: formylglycine-generating enzyme family protein, partial [Rhodomicrobium sp.]
PGFSQDDSHPVVCVNWDDAKAYAEWLSDKTGKAYRLPSEGEWEYACRAGIITPFWWGSSISTDRANYDGRFTFGDNNKGECRQKTVPVKSFDPNPWGLYQIHGNVWEWCEDSWNDTYNHAPSNGSACTTGDGSVHVLRGGSWSNPPQYLRASFRVRNGVGLRGYNAGFRLVRTLTP